MFIVYTAFEQGDTVVVEVGGESYELTAIEAQELAQELLNAARDASAGADS